MYNNGEEIRIKKEMDNNGEIGCDLSVSLCKVSAEQKIWLAEDRCCFSPEVTVGLRSC